MSEAVLDSSAVRAVLLEEPGAERVEALLPGAKVSAVTIGEVVAKLRDLGMPEAGSKPCSADCRSPCGRTV